LAIPSLGPRGEGWVAIQLALMAAIVAAAFLGPRWTDGRREVLLLLSVPLVAGGATLAVRAVRALGPALTPLPRPREGAPLATEGPYALVRHPIYGGGILFFLGVSLASGVAALAATIALALVWELKSRVEERWLGPGYAAYRERVRRRLIPGIY